MPRPRLKALAAAAIPVAGLLLNASPAAAAATSGPGFPAHFAAPYVETWGSTSAMANAKAATGLKYYSLAFVISKNGCSASWNGDTSISDSGWLNAINSLRSSGGDVLASFGGAAGVELGQACGSVSGLQAQYKKVIDTLNLTRIDLDIEGSTLDDTGANDRRNQALAALQKEYAAAGKHLAVDYTLPVDPTGLPSDGLSLLKNAKQRGLDVDVVNIMTMDYGPSMDMGQAAIKAATALHDQLGKIWTTKSSDQLWAMEGNTPMIGVNDAKNEVFSTANATALESFAASKGIKELAFWSLGRDKACASNGTLSDTCSGTSQSSYQFARTFNGITGGSGSNPGGGDGTPSPVNTIKGYGGKCVDVAGASSADGAAVQLYDCNGSSAQKWTIGADGTVKALGKCLDVAYAAKSNGSKAQLYKCTGLAAEKWTPGANGSLVNAGSGRCLDATGPSSANGTRLQIWDCAGSANQKWTLPS
ncbi:ricin-type beta-trefoil lectin domain protein [Actinoallomurus purpureus]|uniref:ricin-type beta-trefoil lectin domain protein n=1 Tax=Actinoallomurus purpureus TaxID=478114 RepID=UPI00209245CF|nr:ricin-type beta-trefoil lectin domain protein [Actinoallomurus purpureus]MCO6010150.1 ricin-type beta-trefoil lectin domain protein [Actinoallomurus purpureus]